MSKPIIHFPMDEDELLLMIETSRREIDELQGETASDLKLRRQLLLLLQVRLSATYKELTGMTCSQN